MTHDSHSEWQHVPTILVVDDTPINVRLLKEMLKGDGYQILAAERGEDALTLMAETLPDLILLDVMMPGMDGYEACRRIKSNPQWRDIPVIIITALNEVSDYVEAIKSGADDFMSKPFNQVVLKARIEGYLNACRLGRELKRQEQFRYELLRMVAHDLNNHIGAVLGNIELLLAKPDLPESIANRAGKAMRSVEEAARLLRNFMGIEKIESGTFDVRPAVVNLSTVIRHWVEMRDVTAHARGLSMHVDMPDKVVCETDQDLLERVIQNVLDNAIKYSRSDSQIDITCAPTGEETTLTISNRGDVISPEELDHMFDKYYQVKTRPEHSRGGSGLGLSFCRMAVDRMGGTISALSPIPGEDDGVSIIIRLPRTRQENGDTGRKVHMARAATVLPY